MTGVEIKVKESVSGTENTNIGAFLEKARWWRCRESNPGAIRSLG